MVRFSNVQEAIKGSICGVCRLGMQSLTMRDAHATACEFCSVDPADLLAAAEEFMVTPEARLEMATADFAAASVVATKKAELWGF